jgi:predicted amidohydrolase YtcJ
MQRLLKLFPFALPTLISCAMHAPAPAADLTVINARIWTGNPVRPWAQALAVKGDRIVAVGSGAEVAKLTGAATQVIDAQGQFVAPGFIDSHVHFITGGSQLAGVQLRDAKSPSEFIARIKAFAQTVPAGTWIEGGNWDHQNWGGELPRAEWIDSVTPNHPVWISRLDGHMALANSAAMKAAGVSSATKEVEGGTIVRDAARNPTGIFKDNAQSVIDRVVPDWTPETRDRALQAAMDFVASKGVTSVHNMGSWADLATFERAHHAGTLRTRIYAAVPLRTWEQLRDTVAKRGHGDEWLRIGGLKAFVDGSLGSHTAAMFDAFTDAPADSGLLVETPEDLYRMTSGADKAGLHVLVHAIGDRAINLQLNIFERVAKEDGPRDRRFRIEHAQHIAPKDIPRFAQLGVIPSMQPYHAIDDGRWAEKLIGHERAKTTYAFRSLIDAGSPPAFGSDWFVAPPTPLDGIYAAVTRRTLDDKNPGGWIPEQKITVEEALRGYTINAARASFDEDNRGSLETGKLADFVIIDRDLTKIPSETIRDAKIVRTVVGGRTVYSNQAPQYDVIIRGGTVYDGTGSQGIAADVAIKNDTIAGIGNFANATATSVVDAHGLAVAPGFINMLSWATESLIVDPHSQGDIRQGVTLEVFGEGESMGPLNEAMRKDMLESQGDLKFDVPWTTLGEYLEYLEKRGVSTNIASFIGATTVRVHEIGYADRPPTAEELMRMQGLVKAAMEEGALGVGSSLIYAPAFYAKTDELIALAKAAAPYGGRYISHMRSEGNRLLEAVDELIRISKEGGVGGEIYHLKAAGQQNWGKLDAVIAKVDSARKAGQDVSADMYTYTAGSTGLDAAMPPWVQEGGYKAWAERLKNPAIRERVAREMKIPSNDWENFFIAAGPDRTLLVGFKADSLKQYTGKTLTEVAKLRGKSPEETAMDLVILDGSRVQVVYFLMSEENVKRQMGLPWVAFGSDAGSMAPNLPFTKSSTHPRAYGNFARVLGKYVREEKAASLPDAIRRLSGFPAKNLKLRQRGELKPGYFADVVVFDPNTITDHATFEKPHQYATGVKHVFVNGTQVLRDGEHTGATPGRVVRGPGWRGWTR